MKDLLEPKACDYTAAAQLGVHNRQYYAALRGLLQRHHLRQHDMQGLREWVEWHKGLGVGRFYIMDYDSSKPTGREIADHISSGLVDLFYRCPTYTIFQFRPATSLHVSRA